MRLIDADKIDFGKIFIGASDFAKDTRETAKRLIDEQPTAYDADKVVERLEELREEILSDTAYDNDTVNHYLGYVDLMIEIIKSGGIE